MNEDRMIQIGIAIAFAVVGWFMSKIFAEIERSRANERELFRAISSEAQERLRQHIEMLKDQLAQARTGK